VAINHVNGNKKKIYTRKLLTDKVNVSTAKFVKWKKKIDGTHTSLHATNCAIAHFDVAFSESTLNYKI